MSQELLGGRFRLGHVIGKGNMGEVHRAEDLQAVEGTPERTVAIKTILRRRTGTRIDTASDPKAAERFAREVRIMRRLDDPNLTRIVDGGVAEDHDGLPYLAMELLNGETLRDLIEEERQLPIAWAAAIAAQIASGLAAAHAAGVVHRDLKPANVMLTQGGIVKVLDFGMGRIVDDPDEARLTSTGVSVGTARYMAPEQFEAKQVTQAADLYALGCVLYEMLVGVPPFTSESPFELAAKHTREEPTSITVIRSGIPTELARLVDRLLAKDPAARPADAAAVRDALLPLAGQDGDASPLPHWSALDPTRPLRSPAAQAPAQPVTPSPKPVSPTASGAGMDVFGVHRTLIKDYRSFTEGGTVIRDDRISAFVEDDLNNKSQWPDPWLSLNPFFQGGGTVVELAGQKVLHDECARIFQAKKTEGGTVPDGRPLTLHRHQREAIDAAKSRASYVLTPAVRKELEDLLAGNTVTRPLPAQPRKQTTGPAPAVLVVDGSNLAWIGRSPRQAGVYGSDDRPSYTQLLSACAALTSRYPDAVIHVVVDATFRHKVTEEERAAVDAALSKGDLIQPPAGTEGKGDALVTAVAEDTHGTVVTNDNYVELQRRYPWLRNKERVLGATLSQGMWVFTPRTCVPPRHRIVRAEVPQQSRALIPPSPGPLPEFRYHRPHEE
ncbi:protein kinase domain-containing protein [Streptomyces sp. NPDC003483]